MFTGAGEVAGSSPASVTISTIEIRKDPSDDLIDLMIVLIGEPAGI